MTAPQGQEGHPVKKKPKTAPPPVKIYDYTEDQIVAPKAYQEAWR